MQRLSNYFPMILCLVFLATHSIAEIKENINNKLHLEPQHIETAIKTLVDDKQIAGVSALIYQRGKQVYYGNFGLANIEKNIPVSRNTIFHIYSMTKPITGVALMQLYEQGAFDFDDPIEKYLPEFKDIKVYNGVDKTGKLQLVKPNRLPTIRDFCMHTAGIYIWDEDTPALQAAMNSAFTQTKPTTLAEFSRAGATIPLANHPGKVWQYGFSTNYIARLVEVLSGKSFSAYISEHIFKPLGMKNTTYYVPIEERHKLASIYNYAEDAPLKANVAVAYGLTEKPPTLTQGATGLLSTIDDYMSFALMLQNEGIFNGARLLSSQSIKRMATDYLPQHLSDTNSVRDGVGFGLNVAVRHTSTLPSAEWQGEIGEFYWQGWAGTAFWVDPVNDVTAVIMVQILPYDGKTNKAVRKAIYQ